MSLIKPHTAIAGVLSEHNELIPLLNRFGIKLGVGDVSIEELCNKHDINAGLLITVLNVYLDEGYTPGPEVLETFDTKSVLEYFKHTADNYINDLIPNIEKHLNAFIIISSSGNHSKAGNYENNNYHYLNSEGRNRESGKEADKADKELGLLRDLFVKFKDKMNNYLKEFTNIYVSMPDDVLHDLKNILIKHISTEYNQNLCYAVIFSIHSFETDICAHNRLRDKVLMPKLNKLDSAGILQLKDSISNDFSGKSDSSNNNLTNRETEILQLIVKGYINKEIADSLNISLNTVLTHRKNIISKTGIRTVSGLTFYCLRNGLISI